MIWLHKGLDILLYMAHSSSTQIKYVFALKGMHIGMRVKQENSTNFIVYLCDFLIEQLWATVN